MYTKAEKPKEYKSSSVVHKDSTGSKCTYMVDNRAEAMVQRKLQTIADKSTNQKSIQCRANMTQRRNNKTKLKKVLKMLRAGLAARGNVNGTSAEIYRHDEVLNAGQHHRMRSVTLNQLIGDITTRLQQHTQNNMTDSDSLGVELSAGRGNGAVAIQLQDERDQDGH